MSMWRCNEELRVRAEVQRCAKRDAKHYIEFWKQIPSNEPYRAILGDVRDKLYNTRERARQLLSSGVSDIPEDSVFTSVDQFLEPLELCYRSLCDCGDRPIADGSLLDFLRQVSTFGLALVKLDIRQESDRHTDVLDAITQHLGIGSYKEWSEDKRQEWLLSELSGKRPLFGHDLPKTEEITDVLDTFKVISELPHDSFGAYIISMATAPSDVLAVELLQRECGITPNTTPQNTFIMAEERATPLRLGSIAPNFQAETTNGPIDFHEFIGDKWVVLFSHPEDYTPVCTTELGAFAKLEPEFTKRGVKLIGLSANTIESHGGWIKDIDEISGSKLTFPIIGDKERKVAYAYDMLDHQDTTNVDSKGIAFTIRSVFVIDPKKTIRLILSYPASTGRNTAEVLRVVDSLQTGDKHRITTPINWIPGDDVIVHPSVKNEEAKTLFPEFRIVKPYLRFTPLPKEVTSAAV